jgi:hypothetical protein
MAMAINRKEISVTDTVFVAFACCDHSGPRARVVGGEVVATGDDGSFVFRRSDGGVQTIEAWSMYSVHATEAEAWSANAERLAAIAGEVAAKHAECCGNAAKAVTA